MRLPVWISVQVRRPLWVLPGSDRDRKVGSWPGGVGEGKGCRSNRIKTSSGGDDSAAVRIEWLDTF